MNKMRFLLASAIVAVLTGVGVLQYAFPPLDSLAGSTCEASTSDFPVVVTPIADWKSYDDPDYEVSFEYPADWEIEATLQQSKPYKDPEAIVKRLTFTASYAVLDFDVWDANGRDFAEWLKWYKDTRQSKSIPTEPNGSVAGLPAVAYVEEGVTINMLTTLFSDGRYVYRLWYMIRNDYRALDGYLHILNSIQLSTDSGDHPALFPSEVVQQAEVNIQNAVARVDGCCGYTDPGNPFSCCDGKGNCVWWVYREMDTVPFRGDAGTWWNQVPNYSGWTRNATPPTYKRSIAYWTGIPGHVAYVGNYTGGTSVTYTEMSWCTSCGATYTVSVWSPDGYIYRVYEQTVVTP